jgi:hypothetical protein
VTGWRTGDARRINPVANRFLLRLSLVQEALLEYPARLFSYLAMFESPHSVALKQENSVKFQRFINYSLQV